MTPASLVAILLLSGLPSPRTRTARCALVHALLGVPHSGATRAFKDLDCVKAAHRGGRLLVRGTLTDDRGTRPLLAPGESCREGYLGTDVRRLARAGGAPGFVEVRITPIGQEGFAFSTLLDTWGGGAGTTAGARCGASGEGTVSRGDNGWVVKGR